MSLFFLSWWWFQAPKVHAHCLSGLLKSIIAFAWNKTLIMGSEISRSKRNPMIDTSGLVGGHRRKKSTFRTHCNSQLAYCLSQLEQEPKWLTRCCDRTPCCAITACWEHTASHWEKKRCGTAYSNLSFPPCSADLSFPCPFNWALTHSTTVERLHKQSLTHKLMNLFYYYIKSSILHLQVINCIMLELKDVSLLLNGTLNHITRNRPEQYCKLNF